MKFFIIILLVVTFNTQAVPNKSERHTHNGRTHAHPLPAQGKAHRHGNRAMAAARSVSLEREKYGIKNEWTSKIKQHVKRHWHPRLGVKGNSAKVKITVSSSGFIAGGINIQSCSGNTEFCSSVKEAFKRSEPLPIPPRNFNKSDLTILFKMN